MSLWDLVDKKEEPQKEVKEETPEVVEATPVVKEEKPKTTKATKTTAKKETKKEEAKFEYPFSLYTEGRIVDISNYGFENGKNYKGKEITAIMLKHRHYEFAGEMAYSIIKEDNTLVATAKQHTKG